MDLPTNLDSLLEVSQLLQKSGPGREGTFYGVLQIDAGASKTKVREAYIRLKQAYAAQSQALYSLLDDDAARKSMVEIEEAFRILNDDHLRKEYDERLKHQGLLPRNMLPSDESHNADPFSAGEEDPTTTAMKQRTEYFLAQRAEAELAWGGGADSELVDSRNSAGVRPMREFAAILKVNHRVQAPQLREVIEEMIQQSTEKGDGCLYRQIREALEVSETEVQQRTKISMEYIRAIENNSFDRLPAMVYVRGFLKSYLQYLGVQDPKVLIEAFSERMTAWQKTRNAN